MSWARRLRLSVVVAAGLAACVDLGRPRDENVLGPDAEAVDDAGMVVEGQPRQDGAMAPPDATTAGTDAARPVMDAAETVPRIAVKIRRDQFAIGAPDGKVFTRYPFPLSVQDVALRSIANGGRIRDDAGSDLLLRGAGEAICGSPQPCDLPFEVIKYDPKVGKLIAWVLLPQLKLSAASPASFIHIYYGMGTGRANPGAVWSDFESVLHLSEETLGKPFYDSSGKTTPCTGIAIGPQSHIEAPTGWSIRFDNTDDHLDCPTLAGNPKSFGLQAFFKHLERDASVSDRIVASAVGLDVNGAQFVFTLDVESTRLVARLHTTSGTVELMSATGAVQYDTWTLGTLTYDGTMARLYLDGQQVSALPLSGRVLTVDTPIWIGGQVGQSRYFSGTIDEVWVASRAWEQSRIALDSLLLRDPEAYVTVLGEERGVF